MGCWAECRVGCGAKRGVRGGGGVRGEGGVGGEGGVEGGVEDNAVRGGVRWEETKKMACEITSDAILPI